MEENPKYGEVENGENTGGQKKYKESVGARQLRSFMEVKARAYGTSAYALVFEIEKQKSSRKVTFELYNFLRFKRSTDNIKLFLESPDYAQMLFSSGWLLFFTPNCTFQSS